MAQPWAPRGHQMKFMNGLAHAGVFSPPPDPARAPTKASLVQPRGGPGLVIKESREAHNSRWGVVARVSHCQAGPVSRPGGVLTADSSPWTGCLRIPPALPTQREPRDEACWVSPWRQTHLCFRKALQPTLPRQPRGSPRSLTRNPTFLLPSWEAASGKHMPAGGSVLGPREQGQT